MTRVFQKIKANTFISALLALLLILGTISPALANNVTTEEPDEVITEEVLTEETEEQESLEGEEVEQTEEIVEESEGEQGTEEQEEALTSEEGESGTVGVQGSSGSVGIGTFGVSYSVPSDRLATGVSGGCTWYITSLTATENPGQLVIYPTDGISGTLINYTSTVATPWKSNTNIKSVYIAEGVSTNTNAYNLFYGLSSATFMDIMNLDISETTNIYGMFYNCSSLVSVDVTGLDTSKAITIAYVFRGCSSLTSIDVSGWDTGQAQTMAGMFYNCYLLEDIDVSGWDTSKVADMSSIFYNCYLLEDIDVSRWNTSSATNMNGMFINCKALTFIDVSGWDTANVIQMPSLFDGCVSLADLDVSRWNTSSATSMSRMFYGCASLTSLDVSGWDTSKVTTMIRMFESCSKLTDLDLSSFNTPLLTNMGWMFQDCASLLALDIRGVITSKVTTMTNMLSGCTSLIEFTVGVDFSFNGSGSSRLTGLPTPTGTNDGGEEYTGNWLRVSDSKVFTPATIPHYLEGSALQVDTYVAEVKSAVVNHTVTFVDWDGVVIDTQTIEDGGAAIAPSDPEREDWDFVGWDTAFTNVTGNLTVTALYNAQISVTVPDTIPGHINPDGSITFPDNAEIINDSVVGVYVSEVEIIEESEYNLVTIADFGGSQATNALQMSISELDIADYIGGKATPTGSFEMGARGSSNYKAKLELDGQIKHVNNVPTDATKAYRIIWTMAAGTNS